MQRTLSQDIRLLGDTLGAVLRAHAGSAVYEPVEAMRSAAKKARGAKSLGDRRKAREVLGKRAAALSPEQALDVVRAFTLYFQLVNLAEDVHRTRQLRRRELQAGSAAGVAESLPHVVAGLVEGGATRDAVLASLNELSIRFVFTAHPTEARRRTTERLLFIARDTLEYRDRRLLTPTEHFIQDRRLRAAIEALWEHASERDTRPEVLDEVRAGLWYLDNVLLDAVPRLYRRLLRALEAPFGPMDPAELPTVISFGSWMGSDRDGNPFVTDAVTERAQEMARDIVLRRYVADLDALVDPLAASDARLVDHAELTRSIERASQFVPEILPEVDRRNAREPLRKLMTLAQERIRRTAQNSAGAYGGPQELLADLLVLRDALAASGAVALADDGLLDLIQRVRVFGFNLAALDIREDSRVHRRVVGELLGDPDYPERADDDRRSRLSELQLADGRRPLSEEARRLMDLFGSITRLQRRFGAEAASTYIISMAEHPADVLEVLRLAELFGLADSLDIVPLFETAAALERSEELLTQLMSDERYRAHVERRGNVQELLVGYSDSMKENGIVSSRILVVEAQKAANRVCHAHGITLRVFHGRGGSVSRGGGPTFAAIRALPREAFAGHMKITEQGETRAAHFAHPDLAIRHVEQTVGAALQSQFDIQHGTGARPKQHPKLLAKLGQSAQRKYRSLVADPALIEYFQQTTPLGVIAGLHIGSRPSRRKSGAISVSDLRAIPWVFAWSQARVPLTGWFGAGTALSELADKQGGLRKLEQLYRDSPFFRDLLDNVQMVLAKSDMPIAARYSTLCDDDDIRGAVFQELSQEFERTQKMVLKITGGRKLLDRDPVIQRSIRLRNPYVDPLSYLQVEALRQLRVAPEGSTARDAWSRVARAAVVGVSAGVRNTG